MADGGSKHNVINVFLQPENRQNSHFADGWEQEEAEPLQSFSGFLPFWGLFPHHSHLSSLIKHSRCYFLAVNVHTCTNLLAAVLH